MMEVKVACYCGTRYKFDVDTDAGQTSVQINCPNCQADGSEAANAFIRQQLGIAETPEPVAPPSLSIGAAAKTPAAQPAKREVARPLPKKKPKAKAKPVREGPNLFFGSLGGGLAGVIGIVVWVLIIRLTGYEFGILAWGIGGAIGFACQLAAGGSSPGLGFVGAGCALVSIIGGQYFGTLSVVHEFQDGIMDGLYEVQQEMAKEAADLKTNAEIREYLSSSWFDEEQEVTQEEIDYFRSETLPMLKEIRDGSLTKEGYEDRMRKEFGAIEADAGLLKESLSLWTLLWLFFGVGTAYRLASGEGD